MKSVRASVQDYDTELPFTISVLGRRLVRNVYGDASTSTDEPAVIMEDGEDKEEIEEASDFVEIKEVVEVGHQTDSFGYTSPTISERLHFFSLAWDGLQVTLIELGRTKMTIFMIFYRIRQN